MTKWMLPASRCFLLIISCFLIMSCTVITRSIQTLCNSPTQSYPAAPVKDKNFDKPATVDLSEYKSVHTRFRQNNNMAIVLAASGGGYRAANLTLGVLMGLEQQKSPIFKENLLQEVDYYSSVSGGGFGVGYYLTQLHNHYNEYGDMHFSLNDNVKKMLLTKEKNMMTDDKERLNLLSMDLTEFLFFGKYRGYALEQALSNSILKTKTGTLLLGDIFIPKESNQRVHLPYWATNSTIYQNAASLPFTPEVLHKYQVSGFFHNYQEYKLTGNPKNTYAIPVSVGVTASASVPFALPPTTLISDGCVDGKCYLQLYDGGLADNLGIYTALGFLLQDKSKIKVLIVVDASQSESSPYSHFRSAPENIAIFWRVLMASTDASREHLKSNIHLVSRKLLCGMGASNVIVIYLDLSHYAAAQHIGTQFSITPEDQKLLLQIGQELVRNNQEIQLLIKQLSTGKLALGKCEYFKGKGNETN